MDFYRFINSKDIKEHLKSIDYHLILWLPHELLYKLGIMKALVSPCPMYKLNGYKTYANLKEKYDNRTERKCL